MPSIVGSDDPNGVRQMLGVDAVSLAEIGGGRGAWVCVIVRQVRWVEVRITTTGLITVKYPRNK
jgi:hypothetical protein